MLLQTPKTIDRVFRFSNELSIETPHDTYLDRWINEVIDSIEIKNLKVLDPGDKAASHSYYDEQGVEQLDGRCTLEVPLQEWLPVGCQCVRDYHNVLDHFRDDGIAAYIDNARIVLCPIGPVRTEIIGPSAFVGEIVISPDVKKLSEDKFKCVIAHELVHVFDMMRLVVPAVIDWPKFKENVLEDGYACETIARRFANFQDFVDNYGQEDERQRLQEFWPSHADKWFDAFRGN